MRLSGKESDVLLEIAMIKYDMSWLNSGTSSFAFSLNMLSRKFQLLDEIRLTTSRFEKRWVGGPAALKARPVVSAAKSTADVFVSVSTLQFSLTY